MKALGATSVNLPEQKKGPRPRNWPGLTTRALLGSLTLTSNTTGVGQ